MEQVKMTIKEWSAVIDNPRQRDTERHAAAAMKGHLRLYSPTHQRVSAARLPGGDMVKLDGHTRSLLWSQGKLKPPSCVLVDVYQVESMEKAKQIYGNFDNAKAAETMRDKLSGAFRESGIEPVSDLLRNGALISALNKLPNWGGIYSVVRAWKPEIEALDSLSLSKRKWRAGMVLGALVLLRVRKARAFAFISQVEKDAGTRNDKGSDAVDAICRYVGAKPGRGGGEPEIVDLAGRFITAGEGYIAGRFYKQSLRATNYREYLDQGAKA